MSSSYRGQIKRTYVARISRVCRYEDHRSGKYCGNADCQLIHCGQINGPWAMSHKGTLFAAAMCTKDNCSTLSCYGAHFNDDITAQVPIFCKFGTSCTKDSCTFAHIDLGKEFQVGIMRIDAIPERYSDLLESNKRVADESPVGAKRQKIVESPKPDQKSELPSQPITPNKIRPVFVINKKPITEDYIPFIKKVVTPALSSLTETHEPSAPKLPEPVLALPASVPAPVLTSVPAPEPVPAPKPVSESSLRIASPSHLDVALKKYLNSLMATLNENIQIMPRDNRLNDICDALQKIYDTSKTLADQFISTD